MLSVERVRNWWENVQSSLWFLPAVLGVVAVALSFIMPEIDSRIESELTQQRDWLFFGSANSARSILTAISGSLITVITLLFSITMLTMQQAATQYTPRIIRAFMRDRGNQLVLGLFLATFLYSLLVLRQIRGDDTEFGSSVPMLSISLAIMLTIVCLALLIYFIHHSASIFQAATIVERIHHEMLDSIERLFPDAIGVRADDDITLTEFRHRYVTQPSMLIRANAPGYLRRIDDGAIINAIGEGSWGIVHPRMGDYITHGRQLVEIGGSFENGEERINQIRNAFILDHERTLAQDNLFGIRQLVDIALKALSPSIHDPTTAEHVISCLGDVMSVLADRSFPARSRTVDNTEQGTQIKLWIDRPGFEDYLEAAFGQIRRVASDNFHVIQYLLHILVELERQTAGDRTVAVRREIERLMYQLNTAPFLPEEHQQLREMAAAER